MKHVKIKHVNTILENIYKHIHMKPKGFITVSRVFISLFIHCTVVKYKNKKKHWVRDFPYNTLKYINYIYIDIYIKTLFDILRQQNLFSNVP